MIDIGASNKKICEKLKDLEIAPDSIGAIFISHVHIDHIKGLEVFLKNNTPDIYMTKETYFALNIEINPKIIAPLDKITIGENNITIIATSHDAIGGIGFIIENKENKIVHMTDTGYINQKNLLLMSDAVTYVVESNYEDENLMQNVKYPFYTKQRIMSDKGHLSNERCAKYLNEMSTTNTKQIFFAHLSSQNNTKSLVLKNNEQLLIQEKEVLDKDDTCTFILANKNN